MDRMPALFIGHGSPMNTLELNRFTQAWRTLGPALPRPRALLVVSAHWFFGATAVTAIPSPRPGNPRPSVVVAAMDTGAPPRAAVSTASASCRRGLNFGRFP